MMSKWIKIIPFVHRYNSLTRKKIRRYATQITNDRISRSLGRTPYPQGKKIKECLHSVKGELPEGEKLLIRQIEASRHCLLSRNDLLVDGTLGEGGIYDKDVTVKKACQVSKGPIPSLMLYLLVRTLQPMSVIELGTNVGISSAFLAAGLKFNGAGGTILTLESSPYRLRLAKEVHIKLGLDNIIYKQGLFADTLDDALTYYGRVDLAFIDGHHQYKPTLDYFNKIFGCSTSGSVFVFDDIRWSDGMEAAWSELQADDRLGMVIDLFSVGIGVRALETAAKRYVFPPIRHAID